jgi:VIT1/CCC1 family predicted Fe2+/Mn2+ transporter
MSFRLTHRHPKVPFGVSRFLAAFEGFEGGFAVGAGVIAGMSFTDASRQTLIMTVIISIIVNGFNSAAVKYSSEHYLDELDGVEQKSPLKTYLLPALVQFILYFSISFISVIPLVFVADLTLAIISNCVVTLIILLAAGYLRATILHMPRWRDAFEVLFLGLGIMAVGLGAGWVIHVLLQV